MTPRTLILALVSASVLLAGCTNDQDDSDPDDLSMDHTDGMEHTEGMQHDAGGTDDMAMTPTEPGQAAFAAIHEILAILEADPATDWSKVDMDGLREHLVDMDCLTLYSEVVTETFLDGAAYHVTGDPRTIEAVQRMVPTHVAMTLQYVAGWDAQATTTEDGVTLTVTSTDAGEVPHIQGLGFFGLMATGAEHPTHHLMLAQGIMHHG